MFQSNRTTNITAGAGSEIKIAGLEDATKQMADLNNELKGLVTSLTGLTQQQASLTSGISNTMKSIASNAQQTSSAVEGVTGSISRFRSGAMSVASIFGSAINSNFVKDLAMFPLRYITGATEQARNIGMGVSTALGGQMYATGQTQDLMMRTLSNFPGGVRGGVEDIIGLQDILRRSGAMMDITRGLEQQNPRTVGMLRGVAEMQAMTPGAPVAQMAQTLGGYAANTQAQQQSAYLTGGAFAMIGAGGRQKSISEWAEGILRWLEGQRPGEKRGRGFEYGELLAQYFPGSNIDAWLSQQGVPEGMKEYFWNFALAKARMTGSTSQDLVIGTGAPGVPAAPFRVTPMTTGGNQAQGRLEAASAQARGQFRLGGALTGMFANKETANTWFNEIIAQVMSEVIPHQIATGSLQAMGVMPDPIQELLMTFLERSGTLGAALGGYIGYGTKGLTGLNAGVFQKLFAGGLPAGILGPEQDLLLNKFPMGPNAGSITELATTAGIDLKTLQQILSGDKTFDELFRGDDDGDIGDAWTSRGTTSTAGLHPSVRRGIERMMGDNPNIKVSSGLRDTVQQRRLRAAGNDNVSGKPSAHTRGLAADLGPRSEYGWITANAHRYGLKSGRDHGEPWHVGLPGIGDDDQATAAEKLRDSSPFGIKKGDRENIGDPLPEVVATPTATGEPGGLGALFDMFKTGATKQGAIDTLGSLIPTLLNIFLGTFNIGPESGVPPDLSSIAYDPGLYAALRKAALGEQGLISLGGTFFTTPGSRITLDSNNNVVDSSGTDSSGTDSSGTGPQGIQSPSGEQGGSGVIDPRVIYDYLKSVGVSPAGAAGILANIKFESNFDSSNATGDQGTSGGLFQHHAGRWAALKEYADDTGGRHWTDWKAQVDFALFGPGEAKDRGFDFNSTDPAASARWWTLKFEIPSNATAKANQRAAVVQQYMYGDIGDVDVPELVRDRVPQQRVDPYTWQMMDQAPALLTQSRPQQQVVFNNTFNISGGGGQGGGVDVRRTVTMMAEQLEGEMRKRLARTN